MHLRWRQVTKLPQYLVHRLPAAVVLHNRTDRKSSPLNDWSASLDSLAALNVRMNNFDGWYRFRGMNHGDARC